MAIPIDTNLREYLIVTFGAASELNRKYPWEQKWFFAEAGVYICGGLYYMFEVIKAIRDEYPNTPIMEDICIKGEPFTRFNHEWVCSDELRDNIIAEYPRYDHMFRGKYLLWQTYMHDMMPRITPDLVKPLDVFPVLLENTKLMCITDVTTLYKYPMRGYIGQLSKRDTREWIMQNPPYEPTMHLYSKRYRQDTGIYTPPLFGTMVWCLHPNSAAALAYNNE